MGDYMFYSGTKLVMLKTFEVVDSNFHWKIDKMLNLETDDLVVFQSHTAIKNRKILCLMGSLKFDYQSDDTVNLFNFASNLFSRYS